MNQHERATTQAARGRIGHAQAQNGCDGGIDGIPTLLEDIAPHLAAHWMIGSDGAV
jgi:hypothetical protein